MVASDLDHANAPVLELDRLEHRLRDENNGDVFTVTIDERITIRSGTFAAILGPSGCGKTTLLSILGLLRRPYKPEAVGCFRITGPDASGKMLSYDIADLWRRNQHATIERLRRQWIGFALQSGDLVSSLTVRENIAVPLQLNGVSRTDCLDRVNYLLHAFGLHDQDSDPDGPAAAPPGAASAAKKPPRRLATSRVNKLSGGEYQRVVLARAIAHRPRLTFVDEPTSALNRELARAALRQLKLSAHGGDLPGAVIMITHDEELATEFADLIVRMKPDSGQSGRLDKIEPNSPLN